MINNYKLVCFDMDGTLIINTNSVKFICEIANKIEEVMAIEVKEELGQIGWIEADYYKAKLFKGVNVDLINVEFDNYIELIDGIANVITQLKSRGIRSILVTSGPLQVAQVLGNKFDFDAVYGSVYQLENVKFTGEISHHLGDEGKLECLRSYYNRNNIELKNA